MWNVKEILKKWMGKKDIVAMRADDKDVFKCGHLKYCPQAKKSYCFLAFHTRAELNDIKEKERAKRDKSIEEANDRYDRFADAVVDGERKMDDNGEEQIWLPDEIEAEYGLARDKETPNVPNELLDDNFDEQRVKARLLTEYRKNGSKLVKLYNWGVVGYVFYNNGKDGLCTKRPTAIKIAEFTSCVLCTSVDMNTIKSASRHGVDMKASSYEDWKGQEQKELARELTEIFLGEHLKDWLKEGRILPSDRQKFR